jgi:hypothetical protein
MFGLDALAGGGALGGLLPGANMLTLVTKGLELIKDLIEQGNTKGADAVLGFLNNVLNENTAKDAGGAAEPQPFTPPQQQNAPLNFEVTFSPPSGRPASHGGLPTVDGSAGGDRMLTEAARGFVEGSEGSKARALTPGTNEWTTIMWAMQQNDHIQYDADTHRFFTQLSNGAKLDVCSLQDVQDVIAQNGGFDRNNPNVPAAVGEYMRDKCDFAFRQPITATVTLSISQAQRPAGVNDGGGNLDEINSKLEELKRKLQEYEAARQVMAAGANITMTVGR